MTWRRHFQAPTAKGALRRSDQGNQEPKMGGKMGWQQLIHCPPPPLPGEGTGGSIRKLKCWWGEGGQPNAALKGRPRSS